MIRLCVAALLVLATFAAAPAWAGNVTTQPSASGSAWTLTYPTSPGTNGYLLQTDGTGVTSWVGTSGVITIPLSSLLAATATSSIDSGNYAQTWNWNTLAGTSALSLATTSTGAASNAQEMLNIGLSGTNANSAQTTYGVYISNTHAGTTSTNVGLYASVTGGTNNYAALFPAGNVGIGTTSPAASLDVNGAIDIKGINGISYPTGDTTTGASIAIGYQALNTETAAGSAAYKNTAIGYQAMGAGTMTTASNGNTAVGYQAGRLVTSGTGNTFIGDIAGQSVTSGQQNTAIGAQAGMSNASGNVAIGYQVFFGGGTGGNNTAVGTIAGYSLGSGASDTFLGAAAGDHISSGSNNTVLGYGVGSTTLQTGSNNILIGTDNTTTTATASSADSVGIGEGVIVGLGDTAVGYQALHKTPADDNLANTAVGYQAMGTGTLTSNAQFNVAVGYQALNANTSGSNNAAVGMAALVFNSTGSYNTALGYNAGAVNSTGNNNTAFGAQTLSATTSGSNNTAIGAGVGSTTLSTGSSNILIGSSAVDTPLSSTSNFLNIGNVIFATGMTGTVSAPAGSVGIGTTSPQTGFALTTSGGIYALANTTTYAAVYGMNTTTTGTVATGAGAALYASATGASNTADALYATNSSSTGYAGYFNGNAYITGTVYANFLQLMSDRRLKRNIRTLDTETALDQIASLRPVAFQWKKTGKADMGLIAQEIAPVYPGLVARGADDRLSVEYISLIAPLIASVQELKKRDDEIEAENEALRRDLEAYKESHP